MTISVITPFYCGNRYISSYLKMMLCACKEFCRSKDNSVEVIFVNDSPWVDILIPQYDYPFKIKIIQNGQNSGIHQSRTNGLLQANGDYVLFLDQDDQINSNFFTTQALKIGDFDIVVGNGVFEFNQTNLKIFGNIWSHKKAITLTPYLNVRNLIISPGQCLIKKSSIPQYWIENILQKNGADDYFLWILMFIEGKSWTYNYANVYIHKDTGVNVSSSEEDMYQSKCNMLFFLDKYPRLDKKVYNRLKQSIEYKHLISMSKLSFIAYSIRYVYIFLYNAFFKIVWRGCHV